MPQWLCHQLMKAYFKKDRRQIKLLNECWFFTAIPPNPVILYLEKYRVILQFRCV